MGRPHGVLSRTSRVHFELHKQRLTSDSSTRTVGRLTSHTASARSTTRAASTALQVGLRPAATARASYPATFTAHGTISSVLHDRSGLETLRTPVNLTAAPKRKLPYQRATPLSPLGTSGGCTCAAKG